MGRIVATLDPHRCDGSLTLLQGGLVVTTTAICDFHRAVFGTLPMGRGQIGFECYFWSTSRPSAGLANLCSVGVATPDSSTAKYIGEESTSVGFRPSDGAGNAGIYNNDTLITGFQQVDERVCLGVFVDNDPTDPVVAFHANGQFLGQFSLPTGKFWIPGVSIGSATVGDVSAYMNFGQYTLDFPTMYRNV